MVNITAINGEPVTGSKFGQDLTSFRQSKGHGHKAETKTNHSSETEHAAVESGAFSMETALNTPGFSEFLAGFPDAEVLDMDEADEKLVKERFEAFKEIPKASKKLGEILQAKILKDTSVKLKPEQLKGLEQGLMERVQNEGVEALKIINQDLEDYEKLPLAIKAKQEELSAMEPEDSLESKLIDSKESLGSAEERKTTLEAENNAFNAIVRGEKALGQFSAEFKIVEAEMQKAGLESVKTAQENAEQYGRYLEVVEKRAEVFAEAGMNTDELQNYLQAAKNKVEAVAKLDTGKKFSLEAAAGIMKNFDEAIDAAGGMSEDLLGEYRRGISEQLSKVDYADPESGEEVTKLNQKLDDVRKLSLRGFSGVARVSGPRSVWNSLEDAYRLKAEISTVLRNPADIGRIKDLNDLANRDDIGFGSLQDLYKNVSKVGNRIETEYRNNSVQKGARLYRQSKEFSGKNVLARAWKSFRNEGPVSAWKSFRKESPDQRHKVAMEKAEAVFSESLGKVAGLERKLEKLQNASEEKAAMELKLKSLTRYLFNEAEETRQVIAEVRKEFRQNLKVLTEPDASLEKALKAWQSLDSAFEESDGSGVEYFDAGEDYGGGREYDQLEKDAKELVMIVATREMVKGFKEFKKGSTTIEKLKLQMMSIERALGDTATSPRYLEVKNEVLEGLIDVYKKGSPGEKALAIVLKAYKAKL
ncbi:MAG: hypothetical protein JNN11_01240 [Candidatus Doudnabacteria bacterium]|nr:hypothetical protein [Candidatus Doudnabacteria bacterium]